MEVSVKTKTKTGALPNSAGFPGKNMVGLDKNRLNYLTLKEFFELIGQDIYRKKFKSNKEWVKKSAKMMAKR
jgi:hypothetical protein